MKKFTIFFLTIIFLAFSNQSFAQLQDHIWYFSNTSLGFLFNFSTNVRSLTYVHQPIGNNGCSVATDGQTGNVLFYTSGLTVLDNGNQVMPNGSGLNGVYGSQGGLICYYPGQPTKYYIFCNSVSSGVIGDLYYSLVDMSLPGNGSSTSPKGDVISNQKNVFLCDSACCGMMVVPGTNNYWLIVPMFNSNRVKVFSINSTGIHFVSVHHICSSLASVTAVRFGKSGSNWKVALGSAYESDPIVIFDFNKSTGAITNDHVMPGTPLGTAADVYHGLNDIEWSPNGSKIYFTKYRNGYASSYSLAKGGLYQYDLNLPNNYPILLFNPIPNSTSAARLSKGLKLAPDNKIYFLFDSLYGAAQNIGVINNPDLPGTNCNFVPHGVISGAQSGNAHKFPEFLVPVDSSQSPVSAFSNPSSICPGSSITLNINGGFLGYGANWYWYSGACGGVLVSSGSNISISPTVTTIYYVRAQSSFNTTSCVSVTVTLYTNSSSPSSISGNSTICSGSSTTFSVIGGSLGTGASWKWYTGGCGQTFVSSGISIVFSPTVNSAYSVRAEGFCNTTSCVSILLTIKPPPIAPLIATSDRNNYCSSSGGNIVLTATGGSGDKVVWYRLSCGGTIVGTGNPKTIAAPTSSVRYWSRWETTGCTSSVCISVGVNVLVSPTLPYAINPSSYTVCNNASGNISLSGSGGNGTSFCWFTGSCGGTVIGTGRNIIIPNPTTSTTYWGRNQTVSCGNSGCRSVVISIVSLPPLQPDTISGNINPTAGNTEVYRTIKVPALIYTWTAPSGWTGTSVTNSITYIVGGGSGVISVVPSNGCGSGPARTIDVKTGFNITGHFTYDNTVNTTLDSVWVYLKMNGTVLDSVRTDTTGYYHFSKKPAGIYNISARTHKQNASINSTDAAIVKLHYAGTTLITSSIRLHSADVNMSFSINTADAVKITRRYVGSDTSFARGDWDFEKPTGGDTINVSVYLNDSVIVGGGNVVQDFKGLCVGDVNGSNVPYPGAKCEPKVFLSTEGIKQIFLNKLLEIPLKVNSNISIGAISLIFNFPSKQISIADVRFALNDLNHGENEENFIYNIIGNELRIAWFENDGPIRFRAGDILFKIILKANSSINDGDTLRFKIKNSPDCEFADENANSIERVDLSIYSLVYSKKLPENAKPYNLDLNNFEVYPNPSSGCFTIKFFGEHQNASIKIYNTLGELIIEYDSSTIKNLSQIETSIFPDGIYFLKFVNESLTVTRKIVVARD